MQLWSNPDPSAATSAALSSAYKFDAADIGRLVDSILTYRQAQERQRQQSFNSILSGLAHGISGAYGAYQQGQADDAANAAMYGHLYPNDAATAYSNPDVVPDYGGTAGLRAMDYANQLNRYQPVPGAPETYTDDNGIIYLKNQRGWQPVSQKNIPGTGQGMTPGQQAVADRFQARQIMGDLTDELGGQNPAQALRGTNLYGGSYHPQTGQFMYASPDEEKTTPYVSVGKPKADNSNVYSRADVDRMQAALNQYNALVGGARNATATPTPQTDSQANAAQAADQIRQMYRNGEMSRDEAIARLQQLGFE